MRVAEKADPLSPEVRYDESASYCEKLPADYWAKFACLVKLAAASSVNPLSQAQIFASLGDKDRTLEALDRAAAAGPIRRGGCLTARGSPFWVAIRV